MRYWIVVMVLAMAAACGCATAATITVPDEQPSIQAAVAVAANGDTIVLRQGEHEVLGQIAFDKSITLSGAGQDITRVTKTWDTGGIGDSRSWFLVLPGVTVTIADLVLDGAGALTCEAIRSYGTVNVSDCTIKRIAYPDYQGAGVAMLGNGTISGTSFSEMGRVGVLAFGLGCTSAVVTGNSYLGKGSGDHADCGVEIDAGAQATVTYNTVTECRGIAGDGTKSAGIRVFSTPAGASVAIVRYNTVGRCAVGIDVGRDISDTSTITATYNNISGNTLGVRYAGREQSKAGFRANWWGSSAGPGPTASGQGDRIEGTILWSPYSLMPSTDNSLYLEASWNGGIYVKPGQNATIWLRVSRLKQMVKGCQAMLGYSSAYFSAGTVAPGGGDWDDMIYQSWAMPGEIDTAIGVKGGSTAGSQEDATVAIVTLTAKSIEGITQLVIRPDADPDPGLIESTFFTDMVSSPVWPTCIDSTNVYIDGTPPAISIDSAKQGAQELIGTGVSSGQGTIAITVRASDTISGIRIGSPPVITVTPNGGSAQTATYLGESPTGTYSYSWTVDSSTPNGPAVISASVSDRSGNAATAVPKSFEIGWPFTGNVLYLDAASAYVRPNSSLIVHMHCSQLLQMVNGCQAMLGFSSEFLNIGNVVPGGGDWDEMIYQSWATLGEIDTAVGVKGGSSAGTQADGTVALITFTTRNVEGVTQLVFRPDADPDPGLTKSTIFSDANGAAVWPGKVNSSQIYIDGTPPAISTVSARQGTQELIGTSVNAVQGTVNIAVNASDGLSGLGTPPVVMVTPNGGSAQSAVYLNESPAGTYNYYWTVTASTPNGPAVIDASVSDRSGNPAVADPKTINVLRTTDNLLYLEGTSTGNIYTRPYHNVVMGMKVSNLRQRVNGCQAMLGYDSTYLNVGTVAAGGGDWDELIYQSWTIPGEIDTAVGVRALATTGTQANGTVATITMAAKNVEGITRIVFRPDAYPDPGLIKSTFFSSMVGSAVWPAKLDSAYIYIDGTAPTISILSARQGAQELIGTGVEALQGTVNISVRATDNLSGISSVPAVSVTPNRGTAVAATYVNESPAGTYNYTWTITTATTNGPAVIRATVYDRSGNAASAEAKTITVNKNTISGQIELQGFLGTSRGVAFVANGSARKAVSITVTGFVGGIASYILTGIPDGVTSVSAQSAWNLRRKLTLAGGVNGQWTADFRGSAKLLGGDINGTNTVNLLDYSAMKANWLTGNTVADVNGDGVVNTLDYNIMKSNWFVLGDPE